jgi:hypothetical protein
VSEGKQKSIPSADFAADLSVTKAQSPQLSDLLIRIAVASGDLTELTRTRNFPASQSVTGMLIKNAGDAHEDKKLAGEVPP